jgi:hypothetical protein
LQHTRRSYGMGSSGISSSSNSSSLGQTSMNSFFRPVSSALNRRQETFVFIQA